MIQYIQPPLYPTHSRLIWRPELSFQVLLRSENNGFWQGQRFSLWNVMELVVSSAFSTNCIHLTSNQMLRVRWVPLQAGLPVLSHDSRSRQRDVEASPPASLVVGSVLAARVRLVPDSELVGRLPKPTLHLRTRAPQHVVLIASVCGIGTKRGRSKGIKPTAQPIAEATCN